MSSSDAPGARSASAPLRRDARRSREALLAAARETFGEQGLGASLEGIAARAGVSIGTLYNHFGGRAGLIDAALADRMEEATAIAERSLSDEDPWRGLVNQVLAIAELQVADRGFAELCVMPQADDSATERAKARGRALTEQLVERAQAAGALRSDVDVADISLLVWAVVRAADGLPETDPDRWRRHLRLVLDGLRASAADAPPAGR